MVEDDMNRREVASMLCETNFVHPAVGTVGVPIQPVRDRDIDVRGPITP